MGRISIDGIGTLLAESSSLAPQQEVVAPDLIAGHWDKCAWYYGPVTIQGNVGGPLSQALLEDLFEFAVKRTGNCGDLANKEVEIVYYCGGSGINGYSFPGLMANSFTLTVAAGDVAKYSIDLIGAGEPTTLTGAAGSPSCDPGESKRLLTWDMLGISVSGALSTADACVGNFEMTVANNVQAVYCLGQNDLYPACLVPGLRSITGSLTLYGVPGSFLGADNGTSESAATITVAGYAIPVKLHRVNVPASTGLISATVGFTAVGNLSNIFD
jgi:hypothetical protein